MSVNVSLFHDSEKRMARTPEERISRELNAERPFDGHVLIYGLMGSGNIVTKNVLKRLRGRNSIPATRKLAISQRREIDGAFLALCEALGATFHVGLGNGGPWELNGLIERNDDSLIIPHVPGPPVLSHQAVMTHALPRSSDIEAFQRRGGTAYALIRHPLDVLVSQATKCVPHDSADRIARRDEILRDPRWITVNAFAIETWWSRFAELRGELQVLRYEDIIEEPRAFVEQLAEQVGCVEEDQREAAASIVGTTELGTKGHFFRARAGTWEEIVTDRQTAYFERVRPLAASFGYDWPVPAGRAAPTPDLQYHVCGWLREDPRVDRFIAENAFSHERCGVSFIAEPDSPLLAEVEDLLQARPPLVEALTGYRPPIGWS